jgi:septal ring factor EnvC (AmiA/AmiB activator)
MSITQNSTFATVVGVACTLSATLLLGGYAYTWSGLEEERKEKIEWRKTHDEQLDKRFDEVKKGQKELSDELSKNNDNVKELLKQILDEQKKQTQLVHKGGH